MEITDDGCRIFIPCNAQLRSPDSGWEDCWKKARLSGLGHENTSFLFKLLHNTLVTKDRLSRTSPSVTPFCNYPGCPGSDHEDIPHALVHCPGNNGVGYSIFNCISSFVPGLTVENAVHLDFMVDDSLELPLVWSMAVAWLALWNLRQKKTRPQLYLVRAEMEAKVALLRECRKFSNDVALIDTIIGNL